MPSSLLEPTKLPNETELRNAALINLKAGSNPFTTQVAAVGTADESILAGVPAFTANQLSELLDIIAQYRDRMTTRVYPLLGERGSGKTHLLYELRNVLRQQAGDAGEETLLVIVERLSPGMDAIDYLLWQIVNHLLAEKGEGGRMLMVIAGRLTARLLAESLRQLGPHQRAELIPSAGFWSRLGLDSGAKAQAKLDAIEEVIQRCDSKNPTTADLRDASDKAGLKPTAAVSVIEQHLDRTESKDVIGWFRKELYARLAKVALLQERVPFDELHMGVFDEAPANVKNAGNLSRRLLDAWLELLAILKVPVVVVFDQLEDYLRHPNPEQEKTTRLFFTDSTARFVNELRNVCILIFAERLLWTDLVTRTDEFSRQRLTQPFSLPGRPAKPYILMPDKIESEVLQKLIRQRLRFQFPDLDLTGLPPTFPFDSADLEAFKKETTVRDCLRKLAPRYDEIVHKPGPEPATKIDLKQRLRDLWHEKLTAIAKQIGVNSVHKVTSAIPEIQNAIDGWLQCLAQHGLTGNGSWQKVELVTDTEKAQYGYLNVIRTDGPNAPGIGVAAWLGENKARPADLRQRVDFFKSNPCPIKTLVMLRFDGDAALKAGQTKEIFDKAIKAGRDIRIQAYEPRHLHALIAFGPWLQVAIAELQTAKETDAAAEKLFCEYLAELSKELLGWIDDWRQPKSPTVATLWGETV